MGNTEGYFATAGGRGTRCREESAERGRTRHSCFQTPSAWRRRRPSERKRAPVRTETLETPKSAREAPETEISIRHLTKRFGRQTILEDLTFDIPRGKITLILGPSGTGKSVFLKNV